MEKSKKYHTYLKRSEFKDLSLWNLEVGESCNISGNAGTIRTYVSSLNRLTPRNFFVSQTTEIRRGVNILKIKRIK